MEALVIGNGNHLKSFLLNGYDKIVVIDPSLNLRILKYATTYFMRGPIGSDFLGKETFTGDVLYCDENGILNASVDEDAKMDGENYDAKEWASRSFYNNSAKPKTRPSLAFIAVMHFLRLGYKVKLVDYQKDRDSDYFFEKDHLNAHILGGELELL